ncbi:asparaginase [Parvibium lacunae]|uniref:Asparaginase n=1 Tax=Parvibium lacunae TaxID=1888893 RepID=A0A368L6V9_9BURK|nr:asparaginase [Parvibium lacunae]RCS59357.1 asparaginase [Parvibium lacunae]
MAHTTRITIVGTGGTIAGTQAAANQVSPAAASKSNGAYVAGVLSVADLLKDLNLSATSPPLSLRHVEPFRLASEDMQPAHWWKLAHVVVQQLQDPEVDGVLITHGTDTLEESAFFLHLVLSSHKPVVLTGAMRPADHPNADGPGNMRLAIETIVLAKRHRLNLGVVVAFAGKVMAAPGLRKVHTRDPIGFANPWYTVDLVDLPQASWPEAGTLAVALALIPPDSTDVERLPHVPIVMMYPGICLDSLAVATSSPTLAGLVLAGYGHGTVPDSISSWLAGRSPSVPVVRASRVGVGPVLAGVAEDDSYLGTLAAGCLSPMQARVLLMVCVWGKADPAKYFNPYQPPERH